MRPPSGSGIGPQAARFLASGALKALVTYALYCVLVAFLAPQTAYALVVVTPLSFVVGNRLLLTRQDEARSR